MPLKKMGMVKIRRKHLSGLRWVRPKGDEITVGLIAESMKRSKDACQAEHFYKSRLFLLARDWVSTNCDDWGILSSRYGLLSPLEVVDPHNDTLPTNEDRFRYWFSKISFQCYMRWGEDTKYVILAGEKYVQPFRDWNLRSLSWVTPFEGLEVEEQLSWLEGSLRSVS